MSSTRLAAAVPSLALALAAAAVGCRAPVSEAKAQGLSVAPEPAWKVATAQAEARTIPRTLKLRGTLEANRHADVAADTAGKVAATFVERGAFVKKGAMLARLDVTNAALGASQAKADRDSAETDAALAKDELARSEKLAISGAIGEAELVRARARTTAAEHRVEAAAARAALSAKSASDGVVRAPFDGLVADRWVDEGEYVAPSMRVVTLLDVATLRLKLYVPEAAALAVKEGQDVSFTVSSDPGKTFAGRVRYVGPQLHAASRELVVEAVVENAERTLKPGGFATALLALGERQAVAVPASALRKVGTSTRLFVVQGGKLEDRVLEVQDGAADGAAAFVLSGVAAGERVVVKPNDELKDGLRAE
jgi:RND family efflux transporter MFP subunit